MRDVRFVFSCCGALCCVVMCGVGVWCVESGVCGVWCVVCGVCCLCVARLGTRKTPVCRFKTPLCVPAKRAHVFNTCARFAGTHENALNLHTGGPLSRSLVPSLFLSSSFFLSSVVLCSLLFSLSNNDNDHSSSRFSVYTRL